MILTVVGVLLLGCEGCWPQARGVKGARERARPAVIWWDGGVRFCHFVFPIPYVYMSVWVGKGMVGQ